MFISNYEKEQMQISIRALQTEIRDLKSEVSSFTKLITLKDAAPVKKRKEIKWDAASKRAASERMKKSWAERKAKKAAMEQNKTDESKA